MQTPTIVLFPTSYFPPVSYFVQLIRFDHVNIEVNETYPKQSLRNRCLILTANGLQNLSIPVRKTKGNKTTTAEIEIFLSDNWQAKHLRAIESAYRSSPFFADYQHHFTKLFEQTFERLIDLNQNLLLTTLSVLKIDKTIQKTENYEKEHSGAVDLRTRFDIKERNHLPPFDRYIQVFNDRFPFEADLSILDLLFNLGPETRDYLFKQAVNQDIQF